MTTPDNVPAAIPASGPVPDPLPGNRLDVYPMNVLDEAAAYALLLRSSHCDWWAHGMLDQRPFKNLAHMEQAAGQLWSMATDAQWLAAFAGHPRIGDVEHLRQRFDTRAISEQGQVLQTSTAVLETLASLNQRYLERHGFIFIICATGKSADEMCSALQARINRETSVELKEAAGQHAAITRLRLCNWLASDEAVQLRGADRP